MPGFIQLKRGSYKSDKPINVTGIDKTQTKAKCRQGSIENAIREPILYSFALSSPPCHKTYKEPRMKFFKKVNKPVLSHNTFSFEGDDHRPVDFKRETISFICQLIKI